MDLLHRELDLRYAHHAHGAPGELTPLDVQFGDYAAWQRDRLENGQLAASRTYWRTELDGVPALELPSDRPRPPLLTFDGAATEFRWSADLAHRIGEVARAHGASMYMVLMASFQALLGRHSGQRDFAVGSAVAGRLHRELENVVGAFVNMLPIRARLSADLGFGRGPAMSAFPTTTTTGTATPAGPVPSLTSVFVRLKLSLLRNGLKQSGGRTAAYILSIVFGAFFAAALLLAFVLMRGNADAGSVAILLTGALALSWTVMPLFIPSGDETLDPSRLVMLPLRPRPLVRALLVASLVGVGPVLTFVLTLGAALSVAHGAAGTVVAVLAVPLTAVTCVALSRAVAAANVRLLTQLVTPRVRCPSTVTIPLPAGTW
ncbi:condensation domain-containing protein, partial [Streptomyces massasporeus]